MTESFNGIYGKKASHKSFLDLWDADFSFGFANYELCIMHYALIKGLS